MFSHEIHSIWNFRSSKNFHGIYNDGERSFEAEKNDINSKYIVPNWFFIESKLMEETGG